MAISDYQKYFADHQQGKTSYIHLFSKAIAPLRDAAIRAEDRDEIADAIKKSAKHQNMLMTFIGARQSQKALQLNQLAYQTSKTLCLINCTELSKKYIGETEKNIARLVAEAENQNWILFFDEADALFASAAQGKNEPNTKGQTDANSIFKYLRRYPGICILNFSDNPASFEAESKSDYVIHFAG